MLKYHSLFGIGVTMQTYETVKKDVESIVKYNKNYIYAYLNTLNPKFITDELILICIDAGIPNMLKYIKEQTEGICIKCIHNDAEELLCVQNQTEAICEAAAISCKNGQGYLLGAVIEQTERICRYFILNDPNAIAYVRNQTHNLCVDAVESDPTTIQYIRNQRQDISINAVASYPFIIRYVRNITKKIKEHYKLSMSKL